MADESTWWHVAGATAAWAYEDYINSKTPLEQALNLVRLSDAMHDLVTYLPGYDYNIGWLREEG